MDFLDKLPYNEIVGLYTVAPIIVFALFCICFYSKEAIIKSLIFSSCAVGSYFPILNTIISEKENAGLIFSKITKSATDIEIAKEFIGIMITIAIIIGWIGCIDTAYQLLFPKKEKQNVKKKAAKKQHKKRH